jgi:hypothetical protein
VGYYVDGLGRGGCVIDVLGVQRKRMGRNGVWLCPVGISATMGRGEVIIVVGTVIDVD